MTQLDCSYWYTHLYGVLQGYYIWPRTKISLFEKQSNKGTHFLKDLLYFGAGAHLNKFGLILPF